MFAFVADGGQYEKKDSNHLSGSTYSAARSFFVDWPEER